MTEVLAQSDVHYNRWFRREFIEFPKRLYRNCPQWVPWFDVDVRMVLKRSHPYFEHARCETFLAVLGGKKKDEVVGRIAVFRNENYIREHGRECAHFYFLDFIDDTSVAQALLDRAVEWAGKQGCTSLEGPLLYGGTSGSGILIHGYEHRAAMNMMLYNFPYYVPAVAEYGFEKLVDLCSFRIDPREFRVPEKIARFAEIVEKRGRFKVLRFRNRADVKKKAPEIADLFNVTLGDHPEDYPLSDKELEQLQKDLLLVADPKLVKILACEDRIVGFCIAFPDLTEAMQKNQGRLSPLRIIRLLREKKLTSRLLVNGMAILPEYQKLGGNAFLYTELTRTVHEGGRFEFAEMVQVAETTEMMLKDLERLGSIPYKRHRMFKLPIG